MNNKPASIFTRFAKWTSHAAGRPASFVLAMAVLVVWALTGPLFGYSDTWQLLINTGTTIVTFLMVFLIQNTQNRDATAVHVKLDELIRAVKGAETALLDVEELEEEDLEQMRIHYEEIAEKARAKLSSRQKDKLADVQMDEAPAARRKAPRRTRTS